MSAAMIPAGYDVEHPWTRQPCDHERAWRAYLAYRDGERPRSVLNVAKATGEPVKDIRRWYDELGWELRTVAYDQWADNTRTAQVAMIIGEDAAERAARHIVLLRGMQEIVGATVRDWMRRVSMGEVIIDNPREVVRAIKDMVTLERLVAGETTENTKVTGEVNLGQLSLDELHTLKQLQEKASKG